MANKPILKGFTPKTYEAPADNTRVVKKTPKKPIKNIHTASQGGKPVAAKDESTMSKYLGLEDRLKEVTNWKRGSTYNGIITYCGYDKNGNEIMKKSVNEKTNKLVGYEFTAPDQENYGYVSGEEEVSLYDKDGDGKFDSMFVGRHSKYAGIYKSTKDNGIFNKAEEDIPGNGNPKANLSVINKGGSVFNAKKK